MKDSTAAALVIVGFVVVMIGALVPSDVTFAVGVGVQLFGLLFLVQNLIHELRENGTLPF